MISASRPDGGRTPQQGEQVGVGRPALRGAQVGRAQGRCEAPAETGGRFLPLATLLTGGRRAGEQRRRPRRLEHPGADRTDVRQRLGASFDPVLGDEGRGEVGPGERRHDRVDARVQGRRLERDRAAVARAGEPDHRVGPVPFDLGPSSQRVDHRDRVATLVRGVVQVHEAAGRTEPAGGVDEHRVAVAGQRSGGRQAVGLRAAESVGQHDRRAGHAGVGRQQGGVERDGLPGLRGARDAQDRLDDAFVGRLRRRGDE